MKRFGSASGDDSDDAEVDISPLIDCVFILLIFFIVTTVFVEETGVEVNKPQAAAAADLEKQSLFLAVTAEGAVVFDSENIGVARVRPLVKRKLQKDDQLPVIIQADENAPMGLFARVYDEALLAGAKKVSFATKN